MQYNEFMKFIKNLFKRSNAVQTFRENISEEVISTAFKTREKEIESLRKYDRGEKTITPSNLKNLRSSERNMG